jgi:hypothetical protein
LGVRPRSVRIFRSHSAMRQPSCLILSLARRCRYCTLQRG